MAVNYAKDFQAKVDEKFTIGSQTGIAVNNDYKWTGAKTIEVQSVNTAPMNDYARTGQGSRYGNIADLENVGQSMLLTKDRSFTFAVDKMDEDETKRVLQAAAALDRQLREVVIPEIDKYRLKTMADNAGTKKTEAAAPTAATCYEMVVQANIDLTEAKVPLTGRLLYATPAFTALLRKSPMFVDNTEIGAGMRIQGMVGAIEGFSVITIPSEYLPAKTNFIATHQVATVAPIKLEEYKIHMDPPGISGDLVEGRIYYDAFVLNNKKKAIYSSVNP